MVTPADIQPVADATAPAPAAPPVEPAAPPADAAPAEGDGEEKSVLPPEVLKIPAMSALLNGSPPATYAPIKSDLPEVKTLSDNAAALKKAGFAAFKSVSVPGSFVMFNGLAIKPQEVVEADKMGKLDSVATPFEQLIQSFASAKNDVVPEGGSAEGAPAAPVAPGQAAAAPATVGAPAPAGAQKRLLSARVANLMPGSPTSGAMPGRGRVLSAISKPVV